ncbi:MAG TPA: PEGA domain-containing protein, partial [Planctomycetota bacterium]|nr:PEGA domain-containing protein [Planctomycetota bacterium]
RTDVYSLGVTLYELLTLRRPFEGATAQEVTARILVKEPLDPRRFHAQLPRELATIVLKAIEKDPARRYATAADLASDLRAFLSFRPIAARPPSLGTRVAKLARRHRAASVVLGASAVLATGVAAWWAQRPGYARITSTPDGATVFVDGVARGATPVDRLAVTPGAHRLRLEKGDELFSVEEEIVVERGEVRAVDRALVSRKGVLRLDSTPPGAHVTLVAEDGSELPAESPTPTQLDVPAGAYRARFALEGFEPQARETVVHVGGRRTECAVAWETAQLSVTANADGARLDVFAGALAGGAAPLRSTRLPLAAPLLLPAGTYSLRAELLDHETAVREGDAAVHLRAGTTEPVHVSLPAIDRTVETKLGGSVFGLAIADLDDDGLPDIVAGTREGQCVALGADGRSKLAVELGADVRSIVAADFEGGGTASVAVGAAAGEIFLVRRDGTHTRIGFLPGSSSMTITAVDVDGDGLPEVVAAAESTVSDVVAFDAAGRCKLRVPGPGRVVVLGAGDLEDDGKTEILAGRWIGSAGRLEILRGDGSLAMAAKLVARPLAIALPRGPEVGRDVAIGTDGNRVERLRSNGTPRSSVSTADWAGKVVALDVDADGIDECVSGSAAGSIAWIAADGRILAETQVGGRVEELLPFGLGRLGAPIVVAATLDGQVVGLECDGSRRLATRLGSGIRRALTGDLDGDGAEEIVCGTEGGEVVALAIDRSRILERSLGNGVLGVAPIVGAPPGALLASTRSGWIHELAADGALLRTYPGDAGTWLLEACDLDGDGSPEIVTAAGGVRVLSWNGLERWRASTGAPIRTLAVCDLDLDGRLEIAVASGGLSVFGADGALRFSRPMPSVVSGLGCGDYDGDGLRTLAVSTAEGELLVVDALGSKRRASRLSDAIVSMAPASLHGSSGVFAMVATGWHLDHDIAWCPGADASSRWRIGTVSQEGPLAAADLDGDGEPEAIASCGDGTVGIFSIRQGRCFTRRLNGPTGRAAVVDLTGDGLPEIVVPEPEGCRVLGWEVRSTDRRARLRAEFEDGIAAAERGDEERARRCFAESRLRWLPFETADLPMLRSRLARLPSSPSAAREARALERVRPRPADEWVRVLRDLVEAGQVDDAVALARASAASVRPSSVLAEALNGTAWDQVDPRRSTRGSVELAILLARLAVDASERESPHILDTYAEALFAAARVDEAIAVEEEALAKCVRGNATYRAATEVSLTRFRAAASRPAPSAPPAPSSTAKRGSL